MSWSFTSNVTVFYSTVLFNTLGPILTILMVAGILLTVQAIFQRKELFWVAIVSLAVATIVFHCIMAAPPDGRYMTAALVPLLAFVPVALTRLAQALPGTESVTTGGLFVLLFLTLVPTLFRFPARAPLGYREVAEWLYQQPDFTSNAGVLVVSEASGEGSLIAEIAVRDQRPQRYALRASKVLASSDWMGNYYRLVFDRVDDALKHLEGLGIRYLIVDKSAAMPGNERAQVTGMVEEFPSRLQLVRRLPRIEGQRERQLEVYRLPYALGAPTQRIRYRMQYTLGRDLEQ